MIYDISIPITDNMLNWLGDDPVKVYKSASYEKGDSFSVTRLEMGAHTGTHIDAPHHFLESGSTVEQVNVSKLMGKCKVFEIKNRDMIDVESLKKYKIEENDRILLKTDNSNHIWYKKEFRKDFVSLTPNAAEYLAEKKVAAVGIDYLSIGAYEGGEETHRILMGAGIWIIEGIYLDNIAPGEYKLICLPLKIVGSDGAPARAVLETIE